MGARAASAWRMPLNGAATLIFTGPLVCRARADEERIRDGQIEVRAARP
jgi:hypothetical protein